MEGTPFIFTLFFSIIERFKFIDVYAHVFVIIVYNFEIAHFTYVITIELLFSFISIIDLFLLNEMYIFSCTCMPIRINLRFIQFHVMRLHNTHLPPITMIFCFVCILLVNIHIHTTLLHPIINVKINEWISPICVTL